MPLLNFKEIAQANLASGEQDTFELFARDVLELLGYRVQSGPDRGADRGRDLIVLETRTGVGGETNVVWLVSCKHKAHSGKSVGLSDEQDISDRVQTHSCAGFIGFYSTIPASSITDKLEGIKKSIPGFDFQIFDGAKVEGLLLSSGPGQAIAQRYFPESYHKWRKENFDIGLALARIGMPQPVSYKLPNEDKILSLEEVMHLHPQGNQYLWDPFMPQNFILCNNILGITKIAGKDGLIDPTTDYFEQRNERIMMELEYMRQERLEAAKKAGADDELSKPKRANSSRKHRDANRQITKGSRKRNRKK